MKVIGINGSPNADGNTYEIIRLMGDELQKEGIDMEIVHIGNQQIQGCIGCGYCSSSPSHTCVLKEDVTNEIAEKMRKADGFILGSPTYYGAIAGTMKSFLDRAFYTSSRYFKYKIGTSVTAVRRAGGVDVIHQLNNYYQLAQMIIPPTQYWTAVYGRNKGEIFQDPEGIQTIVENARTMAWLLKVINESSGRIEKPENEKRIFTNFVRQ